MLTQKYDQDSGLVFSERVVRAPSRGLDSFMHKTRGRRPEQTVSKHGADSLEAIAMRAVLCNLDFIGVDSLGYLPAAIVARIWDHVCRSSLDSIRTWQLFTSALPDTPPGTHTHRIPNPEPRLQLYLTIDSAAYTWLTTLTLCGTTFPFEDLAKLADVQNLASLHFASSAPRHTVSAAGGLDDSVVRGWARRARGGAFGRLQWLFVRGQALVSERCLEYLGAFPALEGCCFFECGLDIAAAAAVQMQTQTQTHGWSLSRGGFHRYLEDCIEAAESVHGDGDSWCGLVERYVLSRTTAVDAGLARTPPMLVVSLGWKRQSSMPRSLSAQFAWLEKAKTPPDSSSRADGEDAVSASRCSSSRKRRKVRESMKHDLAGFLGSF